MSELAATVAEAERRTARRAAGLPLHPTADEQRVVDRKILAEEMDKLEKQIEHEGDRRFLAMRWEVVRFSHPGKTKQTPGIPDRRYYSRRHRIAVWVEWKAPDGEQRPDQRVFQEMCAAVGDLYWLGGLGDIEQYLAAAGLATVGIDGQWYSTQQSERS